MKILVIGEKGYISCCFQEYMKKFPDQIDVISARENKWKEKSFRGYDAIFNTIGLAHNDARKGTNEEFIRLNVTLPLEIAKKTKKEGVSIFIHMSSMIVYGNYSMVGTFKPITKDTIPTPDNIYGYSKLLGENKLKQLSDDNFRVALIRSCRVYGEKDTDSIQMLTKFAKTMPLFPKIKNCISMIYSDNLCELIRLIAVEKKGGIYYPQQEKYICTGSMVKDIATESGHKLWSTKIFNPILLTIGKKIGIVSKVFGNEGYDLQLSNHFGGRYRVVSYEESIRRLTRIGEL